MADSLLNKTSLVSDLEKMTPPPFPIIIREQRRKVFRECSFNYSNEIGGILVIDDPPVRQSFRPDWLHSPENLLLPVTLAEDVSAAAIGLLYLAISGHDGLG